MRVAALFLLAATGVALTACGDGGSRTVIYDTVTAAPTGPSTPTATTGNTGTTGITGASGFSGPTADFQQFQLPSHNIGCVIDRHYARCDINHRDWSPPPRPASCSTETDYGQGVELNGVKSAFVCAGDTTLDPNARVLGYGDSISAGSTTCNSTSAGITCNDSDTGRGFFLSIQRYNLH